MNLLLAIGVPLVAALALAAWCMVELDRTASRPREERRVLIRRKLENEFTGWRPNRRRQIDRRKPEERH